MSEEHKLKNILQHNWCGVYKWINIVKNGLKNVSRLKGIKKRNNPQFYLTSNNIRTIDEFLVIQGKTSTCHFNFLHLFIYLFAYFPEKFKRSYRHESPSPLNISICFSF